MSIRETLTDFSKGDYMEFYWALFWCRERSKSKAARDILTFVLNRMAHRHGGYIGNGVKFENEPFLPHGLHGIYISRYASIGANCCIYQNVTIGEVGGKAPQIGDHCLIGAGAVLVGDITIGDYVKIGAGAVVSVDIPDHCTVVAQPIRILHREGNQDEQTPRLD